MLRSIVRILLLVLTLPFGSSDAIAQQDEKGNFANRSSIINSFVLQSSQLAMTRAREEVNRAYASEAIDLHQKIGDDLTEAIKAEGLQPVTELDDQYGEKLAALKTATDDQFDLAYLSSHVTALESMIELLQQHQKKDEPGSLATFAANHIGGLRTNYAKAQALSSK